ncbi:heat shock protein 60 [Prunus dulcis]|uniref:Heat shock protein 60 n=1 Tax=Prunus dulcis TaxID=3755 RepID=A0A4Y1RFW3_PRUDU|nr:heat shock protein 60 [Prunus dulcis]
MIRKSNDAEVESLREEYHERVATLERKVYALTKERDTLRREQNKKSDAAALLKEKDEIINQVMAEGEELSKKQAAQEGQIRKLRAQIREFEEEKKGLITKLQDGKTLDNELEVVEGMKLDRGYISPYFITNQNNQKCELENPLIIIHEKKISSINDVVKVLELVLQFLRFYYELVDKLLLLFRSKGGEQNNLENVQEGRANSYNEEQIDEVKIKLVEFVSSPLFIIIGGKYLINGFTVWAILHSKRRRGGERNNVPFKNRQSGAS